MSMQIAMIGQKGIPATIGGVERHVHELSRRLAERGFAITVYARAWYTRRREEIIPGVKVVHLPSIHTKHLDTITHTLIATLHAMRAGVDIIHYHGVGPSLWSWLPRLFTPKIKVVATFHSIDRKHEKWGVGARLALRLGEWMACHGAHQTITVSTTIRQYARDVYDKDTTYVPNAVPLYEKTSETKELARWNLTPEKYILMVSRLIPHKGAHYLIEAYQALQRAHPALVKDLKLMIVGQGYYTDTYVDWLRQKSAANPNIVFTGAQSGKTLAELFAHARLMVHPSDKEGMPITVLEGMSYGLPVLLSDIPEHVYLVDNQEYLFARGQTGSLAERLKNLLQKPAAALNAQGQKNRAEIERHYTWERVLEQIIKIYKENHNKQSERLVTKIVNYKNT